MDYTCGYYSSSTEETSSSQISNSAHAIYEILILTGLLWLTGGSINVLEIEFAKKYLSATEMQIAFLFFSSASGAILFSFYSEYRGIESNLTRLRWSTVLAAISILLYVAIAQYPKILPALALYGSCVAYHGFCSMNLVQNYSSKSELSRNSVLLNTITQVVTLGAAAIGVFVSSQTSPRTASILFSSLTLAFGVAALLYAMRRKSLL